MVYKTAMANEFKAISVNDIKIVLQEVFHVYLNKFENAVTHLFLVILGNN